MARDIKIKITGDSSGLKSAFGDAEKSAEGFGSKVGSIFGGIAKAGAALTLGGVAAAVPLIKSSIDAATDFNETLSKTQVLFGDSSQAIFEWADTAARNLGQSRQQAMDAAGTFAVFGKTMGFSGDDLVDFSKKAVGLSSDMASFFNTDPAEAAEAFGAALRGESEPIRKFGVMLNEDALKATALQKGLVTAAVDTKKLGTAQETAEKAARKTAKALKEHGASSVEYTDAVRDQQQAEEALGEVLEGKVPQLTQAQKMQAAYLSVLDQTADAQGDFERTSDGLANKQRILTAEFADARQELGAAFLPAAMAVADFLLQKVVPALRGVNEWVQSVAATVRTSGWGAAFDQVAGQAKDVITRLGSWLSTDGLAWLKDHLFVLGGAWGLLAHYAWPPLRDNLPTWLSSFGAWFQDTAGPWLLDKVGILAKYLGDLAIHGWHYLQDNLPTWLGAFGDWFTETAVPWLQEKAEGLAHKLADWVPQAIEWLTEKLKDYLKALQAWFDGDANTTSEQGGESMGVHIAKGLSKAWYYTYIELAHYKANFVGWVATDLTPAVAKAFVDLWPEVMRTMAAAAQNLFRAGLEIGKEIIRGVIHGFGEYLGDLYDAVVEMVSYLPGWMKKLLGISSPSKVMAAIGGQIAEGLAVGIAGGADQVAKSSQLLAQAAQSGDWPLLSGVSGAYPTITHGADGSVMFGGDPASYPGSVLVGAPAAATKVVPRPLGLGGDDTSGSYSLSTSGYGGGGGTYNITINGVIGDRQQLGQYLKSVLDEYDRARL